MHAYPLSQSNQVKLSVELIEAFIDQLTVLYPFNLLLSFAIYRQAAHSVVEVPQVKPRGEMQSKFFILGPL